MIRIDSATRDLNELLDPTWWISSQWGGDTMRDCKGCEDCTEEEGYRYEKHWTCGGAREVEDTRYGISVCRDEDDLIDYLATVGADMDDCVLVELKGDYSDDEGHDAHLGEELILPTEIVSVAPVTDEFIAAVFARIDEIHGA